jgi:hypothetical protein
MLCCLGLCCCLAAAFRTQNKDGQTITVAFPKQDDCLINNELESLTFKVLFGVGCCSVLLAWMQ